MELKLKVGQIIKIGPKKISKIGRNQACIYIPKDFNYLRGRKALITIEVLEEGD